MEVIEIEAILAPRIGFASHQNAVPLLRELALDCRAAAPVEDLTLRLSVNPPFVQEKTWRIDRLCPGDRLQMADRSVGLNAAFLCDVAEQLVGDVVLELFDAAGDRMVRLSSAARRRIELATEWAQACAAE